MGYSADSFSAGEQPTTAKWNKLWSNDASFNDGTGIANLEIGSGHTSVKNDYKFHVHLTTGSTNSGNGIFAKIPFNAKDFDTGSNFDAVTNFLFTAPVAGFYQFNARCSTTNAATWVIALYKNGTEVSRGGDSRYSATAVGVTVSDMIQLSANDTIGAYVLGDLARTLDISSNALNYLSGFLVSQT